MVLGLAHYTGPLEYHQDIPCSCNLHSILIEWASLLGDDHKAQQNVRLGMLLDFAFAVQVNVL